MMQTNREILDGVLLTDGLIVASTHPGSGKTVMTAGLAGAIAEAGLRVQAIKPLEFTRGTRKRQPDQEFMNRLLKPMQLTEIITAPTACEVTPVEWSRILHICRSLAYPVLIEMPGAVATPLSVCGGQVRDVTDLALDLNVPVLLVTPKSGHLIENITPVLAYLQSREVEITGWVAVETRALEKSLFPRWDEEVFYITHRFSVPYLGELAYSPSINVELAYQGNLVHQAETGIDLLPVQMALRPVLPSGHESA